jgi:hypothetical protein
VLKVKNAVRSVQAVRTAIAVTAAMVPQAATAAGVRKKNRGGGWRSRRRRRQDNRGVRCNSLSTSQSLSSSTSDSWSLLPAVSSLVVMMERVLVADPGTTAREAVTASTRAAKPRYRQ